MVQDPEGIHPRILEADLVAEEDLKADAGGGPALRAPHRHDPEARARLDDVENPDIGESGADAPGVHGLGKRRHRRPRGDQGPVAVVLLELENLEVVHEERLAPDCYLFKFKKDNSDWPLIA